MNGFVKIYGTILDSSIWSTDLVTRVVWITMLAMSDREGRVIASIDGLARRANISVSECESAIAALRARDKHSKSKEHQGRRIRPTDGGWLILNYAKYRELRTTEQIADAERKREWRKSKRDNGADVGHVPDVPGTNAASTIEGEAEADTEKEREAPPVFAARHANGTRVDVLAMGELVNRIRGLAVTPPQGQQFIPIKAIEDIGSDVRRAYLAVGGASRFLNGKGADHSFLVREFTEALKAARREGAA